MIRLKKVLDHPKKFTKSSRSEITKYFSQIAQKTLKDGGFKKKTLYFAVVKASNLKFGLIVDHITGSEEIVVNPIHPNLKYIDIYSGTTIMGDGSIALILDINGIAKHVGLEMIYDDEKKKEDMLSKDNVEVQRVLIFNAGPNEQFAIPLQLIRRVEEISYDKIDKVGKQQYVSLDGKSTKILRLDNMLDISPYEKQDSYYLILPRHTNNYFGILTSKLLDVITVPLILDENTYMKDGILGTSIVNNRLTLFPDIYRLFEIASPVERKTYLLPENSDVNGSILLVDDVAFFRKLVKGYLQSCNYLVETAENGLEALKILNNKKFDLIVSDINMPEMDGWTFLRNVRKNKKLKDIPAIALTSLDSEEYREMGRKVGFDSYETKINRDKLIETVTHLLKNKNK